ncbi:MAG: chemotaxis protein CheB, partial [Thermosynechococcaceae cyanobacterium]
MSEHQVEALQANANEYPVVGIGASAGGIEAVSELLRHLPTGLGMAYVLIHHLSPNQPSLLSEILSRITPISVTEVEDGAAIEPDRIYVIPANTEMTVVDGHLRLVERDPTQRLFMPIDTFLRSLANTYQNRAIGVILSGLDGDGAQGIREIKGAGGITFAQSGATAQYSDMPSSAVATGQIDFILSPAEIATELADISRHPYLSAQNAALEPEDTSEISSAEEALSTIFSLLQTATGVNFKYYKQTTFERRLRRRMALHKLQSLEEYGRYLAENANEVQALYQDVLISVTRFFRDSDVFSELQETVFPALLQDKTVESSIRIWVPGCATGEECYSLAICLLTFLAKQPVKPSIQIFGTDINDVVIDKARTGLYSESAINDIPAEYRRFFVGFEGRYQVSKAVRELCVFAKQNLISDPPFSSIDLISCRNVLIYFDSALQKRIFSVFHYSLAADGFLMLGGSESIGEASNLFTVVDKKHRFYRRRAGAARLNLDFVANTYHFPDLAPSPAAPLEETQARLALQRQADQVMLNRYAPVGVVVNEALDILQFRGDTSPYLRPAAGIPSFNLLKMLRPPLIRETRMAIEQAKEQNVSIKKLSLPLAGEVSEPVSLEVLPLKDPQRQECCYLILFEPERSPPPEPPPPSNQAETEVAETALQRELAIARQALQDTQIYLQATVEEQEATNQRLIVANEEILSSNEELQSTNEELQTAKEEIQAANEELKTTNAELQSRNLEAQQVNDDLVNLLNNVNLPILMLSSDLRIRRFTPSAQALFNFIPADEGRPLNHIRLNLEIEVSELERLIQSVIDTLSTQEQEVQDTQGRWYLLRIRPYRTLEDRIDGAVMVLVDINDLKQTLAQLDQSRHNAESLVASMPIPLLVLDETLRVQRANQAFYEMFRQSPQDTEQRSLFELGEREWEMPELRSHLEELLLSAGQIEPFEIEQTFDRLGYRAMLFNAREIAPNTSGRLLLLAIEDITAWKRAEAERLQSIQD